MTRSRAFNRFNRATAKRRRRLLRALVPSLSVESESFGVAESTSQAKALRQKARQEEIFLDFLSLG